MIEAKVIILPGSVTPVTLVEGSTVADALSAAGVSADGFTIKVDSTDATLSTPVINGSRVILAQGAKSN